MEVERNGERSQEEIRGERKAAWGKTFIITYTHIIPTLYPHKNIWQSQGDKINLFI